MHAFSVMGKLLLEVGINVPLFVCIIKSREMLHSGIPQHWLCSLNLWVRFWLLLYSFSAWLNRVNLTEQRDFYCTGLQGGFILSVFPVNQKAVTQPSSCFSQLLYPHCDIWKQSGVPHLQHTRTGAWEKQKGRQDAQVKKLFSQGSLYYQRLGSKGRALPLSPHTS